MNTSSLDTIDQPQNDTSISQMHPADSVDSSPASTGAGNSPTYTSTSENRMSSVYDGGSRTSNITAQFASLDIASGAAPTPEGSSSPSVHPAPTVDPIATAASMSQGCLTLVLHGPGSLMAPPSDFFDGANQRPSISANDAGTAPSGVSGTNSEAGGETADGVKAMQQATLLASDELTEEEREQVKVDAGLLAKVVNDVWKGETSAQTPALGLYVPPGVSVPSTGVSYEAPEQRRVCAMDALFEKFKYPQEAAVAKKTPALATETWVFNHLETFEAALKDALCSLQIPRDGTERRRSDATVHELVAADFGAIRKRIKEYFGRQNKGI